MATVELLERTQEILNETLPGEQDVDAKVRRLMEAEFLRQLGRYRRTELALTHKYGVSFDEFTARRMTRQLDYNWDVEQDAMVWETAVGSMATIKRKLMELRDLEDEPDA